MHRIFDCEILPSTRIQKERKVRNRNIILNSNLKKPKMTLEARKLILTLGGSFNPIHSQHVEIMQIAKEHLESRSDLKLEVVEGFLAPSTDNYLLSKMQKKSPDGTSIQNRMMIKSDHRINMCNLAIAKYSWLKPISRPFGSAYECGQHMKSSPDHEIAIVIGADRAKTPNGEYKWRRSFKKPVITVIIGRGDIETKEMTSAWEKDLTNGQAINPESYFIVGQVDTREVSSTLLRNELDFLFNQSMISSTCGDKERMQKLVNENLIDQQVADYILENRNNLFLGN